MSESLLMKRIQVKASELGARLFRNNCGRLQNSSGRWIQYGLAVGSSDLIGFRSVKISQDMVGQTIATFVACEVKTNTGRLTEEQRSFLKAVEEAGGIAIVARSVEEAIEGVSAWPRSSKFK